MQKTINILFKAAVAVVVAVMASGCIFEKMGASGNLQNVLIQINVSAEDMLTKAAPGASESAINTLHVYAFHDNRPAGYLQRAATEADEPFLMDLELPTGTAVPVDFYLIANGTSMMDHNNPMVLSENMTRSQLEALKFTGIAAVAVLPLYAEETKNLNTAVYQENMYEGHEGHLLLSDKVNFRLSRSLAKLSVYGARPASASSSPEILSVTMLAAGTREFSYLFPQDDESVLNAVNSRANDRILLSEENKVSLGALTGDGSMAEHYTAVTQIAAYLPEVPVGGTADGWAVQTSERQVTLKIRYVLKSGGKINTAFIYMPPIVRNTHYKVCILIKEEEEGRIYVTYDVADWNAHEMEDYVFTYPLHSYLLEQISSGPDPVNPASPAEMSYDSPFEGYFQMQAPANDSWIPTAVGSHASDVDVKVYEYQGGEVTSDTWPIGASSKWYRIEVIPHVDFPVGQTVDLAITYQSPLMTVSEFLLINGSTGNYYWPGSSDENLVTITMVN